MKKLIYTLSASALMLGACTTFDSFESENYGDGPSVAIDVQAVTDSTFTFTVTPGSNTGYYSYLVTQESEASTLTASSLLKNAYTGVANASISATATPVFTSDMRSKGAPLCLPNTTYQIYAVAASKEGITGDITVVSVTTSDGVAPTVASFKAEDDGLLLTYSEAVTLQSVSGITAKYYGTKALSSPTAGTLTVATVDAKTIKISSPEAPAGAYVSYKIPAGVVADLSGNLSTVSYSGDYNVRTHSFGDAHYQVPNKAFAITDDMITSPAVGSNINGASWSSFKGVFTLGANLYTNLPTSSSIQLTYKVSGKTMTVDVPTSKWSVSGKTLNITFPSEPLADSEVSVSIKAGTIQDVYGNLNEAYTSGTLWNIFTPSIDKVVGKYTFGGFEYYQNAEVSNQGPVTITLNDTIQNGVTLNNFIVTGSAVAGRYDASTGKVYFPGWAYLGLDPSWNYYEMYLYEQASSGANELAFTLKPDGSLVADQEVVIFYYYPDYSNYGWWYDYKTFTFTPSN